MDDDDDDDDVSTHKLLLSLCRSCWFLATNGGRVMFRSTCVYRMHCFVSFFFFFFSTNFQKVFQKHLCDFREREKKNHFKYSAQTALWHLSYFFRFCFFFSSSFSRGAESSWISSRDVKTLFSIFECAEKAHKTHDKIKWRHFVALMHDSWWILILKQIPIHRSYNRIIWTTAGACLLIFHRHSAPFFLQPGIENKNKIIHTHLCVPFISLEIRARYVRRFICFLFFVFASRSWVTLHFT